ncbi:zinc finger, CCHC-type containing protein [Tanacetum coccineum]
MTSWARFLLLSTESHNVLLSTGYYQYGYSLKNKLLMVGSFCSAVLVRCPILLQVLTLEQYKDHSDSPKDLTDPLVTSLDFLNGFVQDRKFCNSDGGNIGDEVKRAGGVIGSGDEIGSLRNHIEKRIASMMGYRGGREDKCFKQKEGIDFYDTYTLVGRIYTIRLLLTLATIHDLVIHQMNVKTAFLNGDLDEEIYMKQPEGFMIPGHESKCVYSKFDASGKGVIICLYMDDMLIFGTDQDQVNKKKEFLSSNLDMKDLGEAEILTKFNFANCSPVYTPVDPTVNTRPDIAFAIGKLSRYSSDPNALHWQALGQVFQYLKGTMDYGLTYSGYPSVIEGYSDASWINNMEDHSSTSGWVFLLGGGAISWASKKQTCITSSTMESEFVALAAAGNEAEWLRNLVYEIPLWPKPMSTISIRCDSAATLAKAYSQVYNGKSRHLGVRHSMIRELIMNGVISVEFVRTQLNLADHLTKGLARDLVDNIDHLVTNLYTIWIGRFHLHVIFACFHRERKPSAPSHPSKANERNSPCSYVFILKSGKTNNVMSDHVFPSLILDDSCISDRDFSLSLMGKVKDITSMPNLYVILENEGFKNLSLTYLGGLWVLIETVSVSAKEKLLNHTGVRLWKSFDDEEVAKDDESQSGDKFTTDNDVDMVSEVSCMHNIELLYDNNHNNIMPDKDKVLSEDPFNLYDILNKRKDSGDELKYPPGFTPSLTNMEEVNKKVKGLQVTSTWVPSSSKLLINSVYAPQDLSKKRRYGLVLNVQGASAFNSFISFPSLINLPLDGYAYTWAHKTANKMSKLDRFLVFKGLLASFPYLSALCLDRNLSDHRPILMRELSIDYGPTLFTFFHSWFNLDGFEKMVEDTWKSLATVNSYELNDINSIDSLEAAQKSKVRWAIEGDENTKFFHGILNSKRSHLTIRGTLVDGEWIVDLLSLEQQADLEQNVSNEEIKSAV